MVRICVSMGLTRKVTVGSLKIQMCVSSLAEGGIKHYMNICVPVRVCVCAQGAWEVSVG